MRMQALLVLFFSIQSALPSFAQSSKKSLYESFMGLFKEDPVCEKAPSIKVIKLKSTFYDVSLQKCSNLFSQSPPDWVRTTSQLGTGGIFQSNSNWFPVCSPWMVWKVTASDPKASKVDLIRSAETYIQISDRCAKPIELKYMGTSESEVTKKRNTYAKDYVAPSRKEAALTLISDQERVKRKKYVESYMSEMAVGCCASDLQCTKLFTHINITFCKPQANENQSDPCVDTGGTYSPDDDTWDFKKLKSGTISLTPFEKKDFSVQKEMPHYITHELSHACSFIQRRLALARGDENTGQDYANWYFKDRSCKVDGKPHWYNNQADTKAIYNTLFKNLGLNTLSYECIFKNALRGTQNRFNDQPCDNGCPRAHIEEAYAIAGGAIHLAKTHQYFSTTVGSMCSQPRDSFHPLEADIFKCILKTPAIQSIFEEDAGCQK